MQTGSSTPATTKPPRPGALPVHTASEREIFLWATSQVTHTLIGSVNNHITPVFNTVLGLNATLVSLAAVIPRVLDAWTDPLMGHLSDRTRTRWGRRRPYIFIGAFLTAFTMAAIWWASPQWSQNGLFLWLALTLLAFGIANTVIQTPLEALGYELTDDYHQRTKVQTVKFFMGAVVGLGLPWLHWLALRPFWGGELEGFRGVYALVGALVIGVGLLPAIFCRERFQRAAEQPGRIRDGLRLALANPHFRQLIYIRLTNAFGATVFGGMTFYINVYYICQGDRDLAMKIAGIGGTVFSVLSFALLFAMPWLGRTIGKHTCLRIGIVLQLVLACIQPLIQTPAAPYLQLVGTVLAIPAGLMFNIFVSSFMPDVCDLGELQSGRRMEGTYSAVMGFLTKLEYTILTVVVGLLITWSGFMPALPAQPAFVQDRLRWFAYVPNFIVTVVTCWLVFRFQVNHLLMADVRAQLDARRTATTA